MKSKYIWIILQIIISGLILYLIYLDIVLIMGYAEIEKMIAMDRQELMHYQPELGVFSLGFFVIDGIIEWILIFGNLFLIFFPFLIISVNIILLVCIFLAVLIFKQKAKLLVISSLIISSLLFICILNR
jgi:hypothetical protein